VSTTQPTIEPLLRPADAAKLLAISERTLWRMTNQRLVPHVRLGRSVRYDPAKLREWIDQQAIAV